MRDHPTRSTRTVPAILALVLLVLPSGVAAGPNHDADNDGTPDVLDNCRDVAQGGAGEPGSCDTDQDGYGNACDGDFNQDLITDGADFTIFQAAFIGTPNADADMNCDTTVDGADFTIFQAPFVAGAPPGPSGLSCAGPTVGGCPNP